MQIKNCSLEISSADKVPIMKKFLICWLAMSTFFSGWTQDNTAVVFNPAKQNESKLLEKMYRYSQFVEGKAFYKNGGITESRFNYNYLTNRVLFINPKGDTLELANGQDFDKITIRSDTFCFYNKEFIQQITHYTSFNLFLKTSLRYNGKEKKAAYGGYSGTSASTSISEMYVSTGPGVGKLTSDENIMYVFDQSYYLSGKYGRFYPATKKGIYELLPKHQKEVKEFLQANKIDFTKKEDVEKLLDYARTLLK
jgi:hypothetical protein